MEYSPTSLTLFWLLVPGSIIVILSAFNLVLNNKDRGE